MTLTTNPKTGIILILLLLLIISLPVVTTSCHKTSGTKGSDSTTLVFQPAFANGHNESVYDIVNYNSENPESTYVSPAPTENFNGDSVLTLNDYAFESALAANILIRFDSLSTIAPTDSILSAVFYLYGIDSSKPPANAVYSFYGNLILPDSIGGAPSPPSVITAQKITTSWDDNNTTWKTRPQSTDTGGIILPLPTKRWNNNITIDITEMAKFWAANPSKNFGCKLLFANPNFHPLGAIQPFAGPYQQMQFYSSYAANAAVRPKLVVTYR